MSPAEIVLLGIVLVMVGLLLVWMMLDAWRDLWRLFKGEDRS